MSLAASESGKERRPAELGSEAFVYWKKPSLKSWLITHLAVPAPPPLPAVGRSTSGRCPRAALTPHSACYSTYLCCCPLPCFAFAVAARRHRWCCCVAAIVSVFSLFAALSCASAVVLRLARRRCRCTRPRAHHLFQERRRLARCCPAHPLIRAVRCRRASSRPRPRRRCWVDVGEARQ